AKLWRDLESGGLAQGARGGGEVAVVAVEQGSVAMLAESTSLTLPVRGGSGEETCREILRAFFGSADGQVRFLGTAPGGLASTRPVLEVWLARRGAGGRDAGDTGRVRWLPFDELLAAAGSPPDPSGVPRVPTAGHRTGPVAAVRRAARRGRLARLARPTDARRARAGGAVGHPGRVEAAERARAGSRPAPRGRAPGATVRLRATPPHPRRRPPRARALPERRPEPDRVP